MENINEPQVIPEIQNELFVRDTNRLLNFLPVEIWEKVITRLPKREKQGNLKNLSNSSLFYRNLLDSQHTTFLFGKVVNILIKHKSLLKFNDVLNCRQVCKTWNVEIDKVLMKQDCKLSMKPHMYEFDSYHKMVKFLAHFKNTHPTKANGKSPFINPKLTFVINDEYVDSNVRDTVQAKLDLISTFMQSYASYIQKATLIFDLANNLELKRGLNKMSDWFLEMTNLTSLSVINWMTYLSKRLAENGQPFLNESFPKLEKLEELHVNTCIPEEIFLELINRNEHISKLTIKQNENSSFNHEYQISNFPVLPKLSYLDVQFKLVGNIANLNNVRFPYLSTLTLYGNFSCEMRWSTIFSAIETQFGNTLERLFVHLGSRGATTFRLNLPKLKEIRLLGAVSNLDFLLPMKDTLERIFITGCGDVEGTTVKMLDLQKIGALVKEDDKFGEFVHFDKSFEDIKLWVKGLMTLSVYKPKIIGDKFILTIMGYIE